MISTFWMCVSVGSAGSNPPVPTIDHIASANTTISGRCLWLMKASTDNLFLKIFSAAVRRLTFDEYSLLSNSGPNGLA